MDPVLVKALWMYGLAAVVSFGIAALIKLVVGVLGRIQGPAADLPPAVATTVPACAAVLDGIPPAHVAAISAALFAVLDTHRIVRIEPARGGRGWADEARLDHHHSHSVERQRRGSGRQ